MRRKIVICLIMLSIFCCTVQCTAASSDDILVSWTKHQQVAHDIANQMRALGYEEDNVVILACQQWWREESTVPIPVVTEYPVATTVWNLLREAGLSEVCAAAILGNMMSECGGQTLDLNPYIYSYGYYGLCMWSLYYFPEINGLDVEDQISYLLDTLDSNMRVAGGSAQEFFDITDVRQAARYFSDKYERPASWASIRAENAVNAFSYFSKGEIINGVV